ncbi:unnamed protein product [Gongylonema pulchrum]|uniref:Uncharacterized protein n=1 Tax=Gongylonema pulchrum TaxID=637853 RepID=A0A183E4L8_9BILA|nr:unnamed protein product [Gongylonema pulchrum]
MTESEKVDGGKRRRLLITCNAMIAINRCKKTVHDLSSSNEEGINSRSTGNHIHNGTALDQNVTDLIKAGKWMLRPKQRKMRYPNKAVVQKAADLPEAASA